MAGKKTRAPAIAFITVCKGRLHHLKESLPLMAAQAPDELIVVDYDSPDGAGDWVEAEFPQARVVRASQPDGGLNLSRARNLGGAAATAEWLFFVDADVCCQPGLGDWLRGHAREGVMLRPAPPAPGRKSRCWGSFLCSADVFRRIGGYDETMSGWGWEDEDVFRRLVVNGLATEAYPSKLVKPILHGDEERYVLPGMRGLGENRTVNAAYSEAKIRISQQLGGNGDLPPAQARKLMEQVRPLVQAWYSKGMPGPLSLRFVVRREAPQPIGIDLEVGSEWALTLLLRHPSVERQRRAGQDSGTAQDRR